MKSISRYFLIPSLLSGIASIISFGNRNLLNTITNHSDDDRMSIASDFMAIGDDLRSAMSSFNEKGNAESH